MSFYGHGLGSAMLEFLIAQAEASGMMCVYGIINPDDASRTPYLFDFYRRHGFTVETATEQGTDRAASIYRVINRNSL